MFLAHGIHPNYTEKHEENHQPKIHGGPVIKYNANERYATTGESAFLLKELARLNGNIPIQEFVVRQDTGCGSTIGPILSTSTGIRTLDVGIAQLSMHVRPCLTAHTHTQQLTYSGLFVF